MGWVGSGRWAGKEKSYTSAFFISKSLIEKAHLFRGLGKGFCFVGWRGFLPVCVCMSPLAVFLLSLSSFFPFDELYCVYDVSAFITFSFLFFLSLFSLSDILPLALSYFFDACERRSRGMEKTEGEREG